jgi:transcriptional regulator with XRE-family HTH domain
MASIGDRIREIRDVRGMSLEKLASAAEVSKGFLSDLENNKRNASSENLLKLANALGASLDYLMRGDAHVVEEIKPVQIPPELSIAAQQMNLSYSQTIALLDAHRSVVARRSNKTNKTFTTKDWVALHQAIRGVFGE